MIGKNIRVTLGRREEAEAEAVPAAQPGESTPMEKDLMGMSLSSVTVVANANRLRRFRPSVRAASASQATPGTDTQSQEVRS